VSFWDDIRCVFGGHVRTDAGKWDIGKWKCERCGKIVGF